MHLAASDALVTVKSRAVNQSTKPKTLCITKHYTKAYGGLEGEIHYS
jgi:hypothetical protein